MVKINRANGVSVESLVFNDVWRDGTVTDGQKTLKLRPVSREIISSIPTSTVKGKTKGRTLSKQRLK